LDLIISEIFSNLNDSVIQGSLIYLVWAERRQEGRTVQAIATDSLFTDHCQGCVPQQALAHTFSRGISLRFTATHTPALPSRALSQTVSIVALSIPHFSRSFSVLAFEARTESAPGHMENQKTRFMVFPYWHASIMLNHSIPQSTYAAQREYKA